MGLSFATEPSIFEVTAGIASEIQLPTIVEEGTSLAYVQLEFEYSLLADFISYDHESNSIRYSPQ